MNRAPTSVFIPPIRKEGDQSGMGVEYEDTDSEHGYTDEETMDDSEHEEHNHSDNENIGNENEDTDEEMLDLEHEEHNHSDDENIDIDNEDTEEDTDMDVDNDNKFHLVHIINDTRSIFEYCIKLRKEFNPIQSNPIQSNLRKLNESKEWK